MFLHNASLMHLKSALVVLFTILSTDPAQKCLCGYKEWCEERKYSVYAEKPCESDVHGTQKLSVYLESVTEGHPDVCDQISDAI